MIKKTTFKHNITYLSFQRCVIILFISFKSKLAYDINLFIQYLHNQLNLDGFRLEGEGGGDALQ